MLQAITALVVIGLLFVLALIAYIVLYSLTQGAMSKGREFEGQFRFRSFLFAIRLGGRDSESEGD